MADGFLAITAQAMQDIENIKSEGKQDHVTGYLKFIAEEQRFPHSGCVDEPPLSGCEVRVVSGVRLYFRRQPQKLTLFLASSGRSPDVADREALVRLEQPGELQGD